MASAGLRTATRSLRSFVSKSAAASRSSFSIPAAPSRTSRLVSSFSRMPVELGALSGMPFHSAVAKARLTSRLSEASLSCRALSQGILCCTSPGL
ncbi:hypothetical protein LUZ60_016871 [Juncus effusus]|nr:hypothetical protein LUZ60_016871 [Juncus effusus]